ncbi:MAG: hypothetical protein AAF614_14525 [Chloroflexota bacterium]
MPQKRKRPFGLIAIIILQLLQVLAWGIFLYSLTVPQTAARAESLVDLTAVSYNIQINSTLLLVIALPGLWLFKRWGWIILMIQVGISLLMGLWQFVEGAPNYISMILNVAIVFYLNQREVQQLFAEQGEQA